MFRAYVSANFDTDGNGILSPAEIQAVTTINFYPTISSSADDDSSDTLASEQATSLKGIEIFSELKYLEVDGHNIETFDAGGNKKLEYLGVYSCNLVNLDVSGNTELLALYCVYNKISKLDLSKNTKLLALGVYGNELEELDISNNKDLKWLFAEDNSLKQLDISNNPNLIKAYKEGEAERFTPEDDSEYEGEPYDYTYYWLDNATQTEELPEEESYDAEKESAVEDVPYEYFFEAQIRSLLDYLKSDQADFSLSIDTGVEIITEKAAAPAAQQPAGRASGEPKGNNSASQELGEGYVTEYKLDEDITVHAYSASGEMADGAFLVETKDALVAVNLPADQATLDEWTEYAEKLGKPCDDIFLTALNESDDLKEDQEPVDPADAVKDMNVYAPEDILKDLDIDGNTIAIDDELEVAGVKFTVAMRDGAIELIMPDQKAIFSSVELKNPDADAIAVLEEYVEAEYKAAFGADGTILDANGMKQSIERGPVEASEEPPAKP